MKKWYALAASALVPGALFAAQADQAEILKKIEAMQQQIAEQQAVIQSMKAQLGASSETVNEVVKQEIKEELKREVKAEIERGFAQTKHTVAVRPSSSNIKDLQMRGRVQGQFGYTRIDNDDGKEDYSTFEMRRIRLGMRGTLFNDFRAQVEANMLPTGTNQFSMRSAFIQWREHKPAYIKLGYDKPIFGFEENTSSAEILTIERTLINNTLVTGPLTGLSLSGTQSVFEYNAGLYTDQHNTNAATEQDRYLLNLSAGIKLDDMIGGGKLRFRADYLTSDDPGGRMGGTYDKDAMAFSGHFEMKGFDLRAEYMIGRRDNGNDVSGWYVMPSQYLTENLQGVARFEMAKSDAGNGLRAPGRYMRNAIDGPGANQRGDKYMAGYLGLNYYMASHRHKLMLGVEMAKLEDTPKGDLQALTCYTAWRMLF